MAEAWPEGMRERGESRLTPAHTHRASSGVMKPSCRYSARYFVKVMGKISNTETLTEMRKPQIFDNKILYVISVYVNSFCWFVCSFSCFKTGFLCVALAL